MIKREVFAVITGVAVAAAIALAVLLPRGAQSKTHSNKDDRINKVRRKISSEIYDGKLSAAEADINALRQTKSLRPGALDSLLAELYFKEGRNEEARVVYRRMIFNPHGFFGDPYRLMTFAKLSDNSGHLDDAKVAYSKVIDLYAIRLDSALKNSMLACDQLRDYRAIAHALDCMTNSGPNNIADIQAAVAAAPKQPITHFVYAQFLNAFARRRSANAELDKAAALLPSSVAAKWKAEQYSNFSFDLWDHGTGGVVGKNGKVTFKVYKMPLTDSTTPMVYHSPKQIRPKTP